MIVEAEIWRLYAIWLTRRIRSLIQDKQELLQINELLKGICMAIMEESSQELDGRARRGGPPTD